MDDLMNEVLKKMQEEMHAKKEAFIKEMLEKKGYQNIIPAEKMRFPKINRSIAFDGWEYIFVDNQSKQGDFIVAIGPWEHDNNFDFSKISDMSASCQTTYTFKWQDKNFDAVRIP
jgi:hypothetical protein